MVAMLKIEGSNPLHGLFLLTRTEFINDFHYFHLCGQTDRHTDTQTDRQKLAHACIENKPLGST